MSRLLDLAAGAEDSFKSRPEPPQFRMPEAVNVLSVGPVDCGSMVHDALIGGLSFRLIIATDYLKLWSLPSHESVHVAILHNKLSSFEIEAACRLIRRRWPATRILLVWRGESSIDDALYDDRVEPTVAPQSLLAAIERLGGRGDEWIFHLRDRSGQPQIGGLPGPDLNRSHLP